MKPFLSIVSLKAKKDSWKTIKNWGLFFFFQKQTTQIPTMVSFPTKTKATRIETPNLRMGRQMKSYGYLMMAIVLFLQEPAKETLPFGRFAQMDLLERRESIAQMLEFVQLSSLTYPLQILLSQIDIILSKYLI